MANNTASRKKRRIYTEEYKRDLVNKLVSGDYTLARLSTESGVSVVSLLKWKRELGFAVGRNRGASVQASAAPDVDASTEIARLRAEVQRLTEERDRLRRGIAYLTGVVDH